MTTASASTPRFFTSACVMSRIMPAFCSSVRPAAILTVISGIIVAPCFISVMAGLVPAIHDFSIKQDVDARHKAGHDAANEWLSPLHVMARQNFAHFGDDLAFAAGKLRRTGLAPFLVGGDRRGCLGALDQILDLHLAARLF